MKTYQENISALEIKRAQLKQRDSQYSVGRLLIIITAAGFFYQSQVLESLSLLGISVLILFGFLLVLRFHSRIRNSLKLTDVLIDINKKEIDFLKGNKTHFEDGKEFTRTDHPFSYDLDFFGPNSLYQHLNRSGTVFGKEGLADTLVTIKDKDDIQKTQEAIKELSAEVGWRQLFLAQTKIHPDNGSFKTQLQAWLENKPEQESTFVRLFAFVGPMIVVCSALLYFITPFNFFGQVAFLGILANLIILATRMQAIKNELLPTTKIERILKQYAILLKSIETASFKSEKLDELQKELSRNTGNSSQAIEKLSSLFGLLEHVTNIFASPVLNGTLLFHIHILGRLGKWRKEYAKDVFRWLEIIGEFEAMSSLANYSYNNPDFVFPSINNDQKISFEALGHPLIHHDDAVTNIISFENQRFFVLTGSNMSGKSTFLRTLGINMVLGGIGAPVFAKEASIHPMPVLVSMRLSDSLSDSKSYFYTEVQRLKFIMEKLENQACYVLLDEILRGTNSDDKRNGTMEVIRKISKMKAFGGIATHDLEVCNVTDEFPTVLTNKRFEVEIINNELLFDYRLRDGICENRSASFIMKKEGVI